MFGVNKEKFKLFYDKYYHLVYKVVSEKLSDDYIRQEVIQNTFIHLWKHYNLILKTENPQPIILKTIYQEISNYFRKNPIQSSSAIVEYADCNEIDIEHKQNLEDLISKALILLDRLPERRKIIFTRSRIENKTYKEIGEEFNMSISAIENQIRKTLDFLRTNLS